jgi:hypothetical protein
MAQAIAVFETAVLQALRVAGAEKGSEWSSTGSTAWQTQLGPEEDPKRR